MNLRKYYDQVHKIRQDIKEPFVLLSSLATPNGGKEGCVSEVPAELAARMIADGVAQFATSEQIEAYHSDADANRLAAQEEQLRNRLRITLVNEGDMQFTTEKSSAKPRGKA
jgi:hypothetical protein